MFPKKLVSILIIFILILKGELVFGGHKIACNSKFNACIKYTNTVDLESTLNALEKVYGFFSNFGYSEKYFLKIVFQKEVKVKFTNNHITRVYGKNGKDNHIYLTNWNEEWLSEQNSYGLKMSREFYESIIIHEIAHFVAERIAGQNIEITNSEYIAYVVQLSQMHPERRQEILRKNPRPAFNTEEINLDIMLFDPSTFAVKSYFHFKKNNGQYLKSILNGTIKRCLGITYWDIQ